MKLLDFGIARSADLPGDRLLTGERVSRGPRPTSPGSASSGRRTPARTCLAGRHALPDGDRLPPFPGATPAGGAHRRAPSRWPRRHRSTPSSRRRSIASSSARSRRRRSRYQDVAARPRRPGRPSAGTWRPGDAEEGAPGRDDARTIPLHARPILDAFLTSRGTRSRATAATSRERGVGVMHWFGVPLGAISYPDGFQRDAPGAREPPSSRNSAVLDEGSSRCAAWAAHVPPRSRCGQRRGQAVEVREDEGGARSSAGTVGRSSPGASATCRWSSARPSLFADDTPGARVEAQLYIATSPARGERAGRAGVPRRGARDRHARRRRGLRLLAALLRRTRGLI